MPNVTIIQPTVPSFRLGFFDRLSAQLGKGFAVYASALQMGVLTSRSERPEWERPLGPIRPVAPGLEWQVGATSVPVGRGDVVVVFGNPRCLSNLALIVKARLVGAQSVWWGHFRSSTSRDWSTLMRLMLMRSADAALFYTDREINEHRTFRGSSARQALFALNNGIETGRICALRVAYVAAQRPRDLLFIGRLTDKAEIELLLRALARPEASHATLDIIGGGEEQFRLVALGNDLGLGDRVVWHGGSTDEDRIAAIANQCKAFVYPGGVGLSLIHGLAYGLPGIVHNARWGHMPEIAAHAPGVNGLTFEQGSAPALAATIATTLGDPAALVRMSAAAIETTTRSFNAEDMARRFCAMVEALSAATPTSLHSCDRNAHRGKS